MTTATVTTDQGMKNSLAVSAFLHVLLLLFLYFGLPRLFTPLPEHHVPVPFEIVELADITNTRVKEPEPQVKPPEPQPAKPQPKQEQVQAVPQPKPPEPQAEAIKPAQKPPPPKTEVKPQSDDFAKMLKNLEQNKKTEAPKSDSKIDSKTKAQESASQAPSLSNRLTISEEDLLRRQISQCWNMPIGARDAQSLIVEVLITVNPDRTVQTAEVVDKSRMATDSFYRSAGEAALRALYNPKCSPLELPPDKYDQWKSIDFTFDPRDML